MAATRLSKNRKQEIELEGLRKRLRKAYKLERVEASKLLGIDERKIVRVGWFKSEANWVAERIERFKRENLELPGGTYQEADETKVAHQRKFIEVLRDTSPDLIEELRDLAQYLRAAFGSVTSDDDIFKIIDAVVKFGALYRNQAESPVGGFLFTQSTSSIWDHFSWKRYKVPLLITKMVCDIENGLDPRNIKTGPDVTLWFKEIRSSFPEEYVLESVKQTAARMKKVILKSFRELIPAEDWLFPGFLSLQCGLYDWMERHHLERDFILMNAYLFVGQFCRNPAMEINDLVVFPRRHYTRLHAQDFKFETEGWWANSESAESFRRKTLDECDRQIHIYLRNSYDFLNLANKTHITKPKDPDFESIFWLIAWNEGATYRQIGQCFNRSGDAIKDGTAILRQFELPKRKDRPGRKKAVIVNDERINVIRTSFLNAEADRRQKQGKILSENP